MAGRKKKEEITRWEPENFKLEISSIWSFPDRGSWATHSSKYRGNFSPYIPRNVILRYSKEGDLVLDQFAGSGTTLIEAKLLNRRCIGLDINPDAVQLTNDKLQFNTGTEDVSEAAEQEKEPEEKQEKKKRKKKETQPEEKQEEKQGLKTEGEDNKLASFSEHVTASLGDARRLRAIDDGSVDLICTHPPYANIIKYSEGIDGDLSQCDVERFYEEMQKVADESYRVLKKDKFCAILIGDTRKKGHIVPMGFRVMEIFKQAGFKLKEIIVKEQHNCSSTGYWRSQSVRHNFFLIMHEYLFIFKK